MELAVRHQTTYRYATPANQVSLLLRLLPGRLDGQQTKAWEVTVNGTPVTDFPLNAFGDGEGFYHRRGAFCEMEIVASGTVATQERHGIVSGFPHEAPLPVFLRQTQLTRPDAAILALARSIAEREPIPRLHALSAKVREAIAYESGATTSATTAAEALALGRGVCQDHANLFVSAARSLGIPARYISGYLLADEAGHALRETHAWAEAWVDGLGWVGFDATNGLCITELYVRLCSGLDAHDAAPVRGSVYGTTEIGIQADVMISLAAPSGSQQVQQQQ
ncbi:MAG: transglutaminase family protein [Holophagaceae bacterium]